MASDTYTGTYREAADRKRAADASEASEMAAGTKINTGLGDLIKKTEKGAAPVATPAPLGAPKREDFPLGLGGQGEFNRALSAWKAKNETKPVTGGKSLGGSR